MFIALVLAAIAVLIGITLLAGLVTVAAWTIRILMGGLFGAARAVAGLSARAKNRRMRV